MKIGFGTVLWGRRIDDLEYALDVIQACGYKGIELAQHHEEIFLRTPDGSGTRKINGIAELLHHLEKRGLTLIGLVAGKLGDRMAFLGDHKEPYLYIDRWSDKIAGDVEAALQAGFIIAIHPHWLMPIRRLKQAISILKRYKDGPYSGQVRLLLDTAHALIAEDDPVKAARVHNDRLAGVHIKSWRPDYGRWSHRYAHGFCPPGEGIVPVAEVMDVLSAADYWGWVIVEQDHYDVCREQTALCCAQWLEHEGHRWGVTICPNASLVRELQTRCRVNPYFETLGAAGVEQFVIDSINGKRQVTDLFKPPLTALALSGPLSELLMGRKLSRRVAHRLELYEFCAIISASVRVLLDSECVKVWSYNPLIGDSGEFCLLAIDAPYFKTSHCKTNIAETDHLAGEILTHPAVRQLDLRDERNAGRISDKEWLAQLQMNAPWLLVLPVFNTSNTHHLRYLITSAGKDPLLKPLSADTFEEAASRLRLGQLEAISWIVAYWADYLTDETCSAAAGYTNHLCGNAEQSVTDFLDSVADYLQETFKCNQVTVFLEDITGQRLEPVGKSDAKLVWDRPLHYYLAHDRKSHTWKAWMEREMVFSSTARAGIAREIRPANDDRDEILFAPLARRGGKCHGVIRLHNKKRPAGSVSSMFTDDDAAKLDAIVQTALPHLELLKLQEQQLQSLTRMVHEFQTPLVAIRGAVDLMQADLRKKNQPAEQFFRRDFLDDVLQWTELMGRLTRNAQIFAGGMHSQVLRPKRTLLLGEVVMPVLRQIRPLVPDGIRLDSHSEDLRQIPRLYLDRHQMQQVIFNLMSNSIKYGGSKDFIRVRISGGPVGNSFSIFFEDWGTGIPLEEKEEIFYPGFRGQKAALSNVAGLGIGLYVVRRIVEAHGGSIHVRSCKNPTTFEIILPQWLRHRSPNTAEQESL